MKYKKLTKSTKFPVHLVEWSNVIGVAIFRPKNSRKMFLGIQTRKPLKFTGKKSSYQEIDWSKVSFK
jgi:hypothetical protein